MGQALSSPIETVVSCGGAFNDNESIGNSTEVIK